MAFLLPTIRLPWRLTQSNLHASVVHINQLESNGSMNSYNVVTCSDNLYINLRKFWQLKSVSGNTMWPMRNNYLKRK